MLAMGVLLVVGGRLGDKFGQRRLFLIGMSGFTLASAAAGLSTRSSAPDRRSSCPRCLWCSAHPAGHGDHDQVVLSRDAQQGVRLFGPLLGLRRSAGRSWPASSLVPTGSDCPGGRFSCSTSSSARIGLVLAVKILPTDDGDRSTVVDGWGSGLLGATMFGLLYGLIEGSTNGWTAIPIASILAGVLFFAHSRTARHRDRPADQAVAATQPGIQLRAGRRPGRLRRHHRAALRTVAVHAGGLHASPRSASVACSR